MREYRALCTRAPPKTKKTQRVASVEFIHRELNIPLLRWSVR